MIQTADSSTLNLFVSAVQELSMARDMETVTRIVRTAARRLTGADGATFILKDRDMCFYADEDAISPLWKGNRFPLYSCISGWAMLNKKHVIIEDIYKDERIPIDLYRPTFVKSLAMVPIRTMDPIGAIGNYWAEFHLPTKEELHLLQSLADITAVTIENIGVYRELEQRVKERTEQLEATNKELEAFSYSVSHDLRAPLRSIMGYSEILKEDHFDELSDSGKQALATVQSNAGKMNHLIDDLLQFSRFGRQQVNKSEVDMTKLVKTIIDEINYDANRRPDFNIGNLHNGFADKALILQVWINLISNAVKYSSKVDKPKIAISSKVEDGQVIYSINDNGAGFNMDYAGKLFIAFQRLHTASDFPGSGIGLALAHRIVTRHGGRMWAEGKVGEGATFSFSLPAVE